MTLIEAIDATLDERGWRLRKSTPRSAGRLTLEADRVDGEVAAGQWYADPGEAAGAARLLVSRFGPDDVSLLDDRLLLQRAGADRKLPVVHRLVARPGTVLVAHRAERRAVVRRADGRYVKVVRPERVDELLRPMSTGRFSGVRTPEVVEVDEQRGCVTTEALPGSTLHTRLLDPGVTAAEVARDAESTGRALRALHSQDVDHARAAHTAEAELEAARRWLDAAVLHGLVDPDACRRAFDAVATALRSGSEPAVATVHRDLHEKQVLVGSDDVGILDLDLACTGEPSVDVANLVAHLHLRHAQCVVDGQRAAQVAQAFLTGYGEPAVRPDRFDAYLASTTLRLAGVYAFRPSRPGLSDELLASAAAVVATGLH